MSGNLIRLLPGKGEPSPNQWIGRIAIFEMITGSRIQGKIIALNDDWIDTDNGAIRVEHIVHARWVNQEEAEITRSKHPLNFSSPYRLR